MIFAWAMKNVTISLWGYGDKQAHFVRLLRSSKMLKIKQKHG